jgi:GTPase SAR1 family protein
MRIAFMGGACSGKTTLIKQFLQKWPEYTQPTKTYRDLITEKNLSLNKEGTRDSQKIILDALIEEIDSAVEDGVQNIVFDRCVIDNIAYSLWLYESKKVSQEFIIDSKYKARKAVEKYDIIFYVPRSTEIKLEEREGREVDEIYIQEIDNIFSALVTSYEMNKDTFFPKENCPAVITLNCPPDLRCEMIQLYLKNDGTPYTEEDGSLIYN